MTAIAFFLSLDLRILREVLDLVKAKILYKVHFNKFFFTDRVILQLFSLRRWRQAKTIVCEIRRVEREVFLGQTQQGHTRSL